MISKERAKERISWIDTAKGFLMLCVIAGHTLRLGSVPKRMIYSFHIPLFLSGFFICKIPGFHGFYQQFEKVPFFMFFLFCGRYARKYNVIEVLEKHAVLILFFALIIWQIFLPHSYFDLGLFYLGDPRFAIPCSFVACLTVIILCRTVDSYLANGGKILRLPYFIGQHSILLLTIHDLEFMFFPWHTNFTSRFDEYGTLLLRIAFDLAVWGMIMFLRWIFEDKGNKR